SRSDCGKRKQPHLLDALEVDHGRFTRDTAPQSARGNGKNQCRQAQPRKTTVWLAFHCLQSAHLLLLSIAAMLDKPNGAAPAKSSGAPHQLRGRSGYPTIEDLAREAREHASELQNFRARALIPARELR